MEGRIFEQLSVLEWPSESAASLFSHTEPCRVAGGGGGGGGGGGENEQKVQLAKNKLMTQLDLFPIDFGISPQ